LHKILRNEKYIGDALLQKTYTVDFLNKKRVQNKGIVPQYYVENSHEAIIPRDIFMRVQEEMVRRANLHSGEKRKKRVYSSKYALSSIVCCSKCGDIYRRITEESVPQCGDAAPELILAPASAMHQLSAKQNSKMQLSRQSIRHLVAEEI
jgi:hypothetical protein